jgi:thymidylate synthase (FAD)
MQVELIQHVGDDLLVANAARVSFNKESDWDHETDNTKLYWQKLSERDTKLISYLARHNHFTPFTHCVITLRETVPIFVARQRFKHVVGFTYNEVSRRYVDDTPEFFVPDVWRSKPVNAKQGSGVEEITHLEWAVDSETIEGYTREDVAYEPIHEMYKEYIDHCKWMYELMIENDVAPEQARMVLPQSMYTSYYVTGSLMAFARAYKLRIDPHAQKEIQDLAVMWKEKIEPLYPISWKALTDGVE